MSNKHMISVMVARNGWTVKTRSGLYVCATIDDLIKQVREYALVIQKEARAEAAATTTTEDEE